jgi:hypothetical protein
MNINNRQRAIKLKRTFFVVSVLLAIAALILFLLSHTYMALSVIGVFSLWYLYFMIADYYFIEFKAEKGMIRLRYYKAISFGGTSHNEIEFPQQILKKAVFENSFFGRNTDLIIFVRTQKGIAEYPSVSLTALTKDERERIADLFNSVAASN